MSDPFLSEIRIMAFIYAPRGWALCNGQQLPINQNQALFSLLGTTYGGNGQTTFALPDLRGRVPIHMGSGFTLGETAGQQAHTVTISEMSQHLHAANASAVNATATIPNNTLTIATGAGFEIFHTATNLVAMAANMVANVGGSQPHENMQPYLTLSFCIALVGIFPSQN
jgi:microcystin-dependent protein